MPKWRANYYEILGLEPSCTDEDIEYAYKDLRIVWHPDRIAPFKSKRLDKRANVKFQIISEAYETLKSCRARYDQFLAGIINNENNAKSGPRESNITPSGWKVRRIQRIINSSLTTSASAKSISIHA